MRWVGSGSMPPSFNAPKFLSHDLTGARITTHVISVLDLAKTRLTSALPQNAVGMGFTFHDVSRWQPGLRCDGGPYLQGVSH